MKIDTSTIILGSVSLIEGYTTTESIVSQKSMLTEIIITPIV